MRFDRVFRDNPCWAGRLVIIKKFSKHTPEQIVAKLGKARSMRASGVAYG